MALWNIFGQLRPFISKKLVCLGELQEKCRKRVTGKKLTNKKKPRKYEVSGGVGDGFRTHDLRDHNPTL